MPCTHTATSHGDTRDVNPRSEETRTATPPADGEALSIEPVVQPPQSLTIEQGRRPARDSSRVRVAPCRARTHIHTTALARPGHGPPHLSHGPPHLSAHGVTTDRSRRPAEVVTPRAGGASGPSPHSPLGCRRRGCAPRRRLRWTTASAPASSPARTGASS
eukprot:TRINITY_DN62601_c0_g1_i1.p2 TRINITY_DN62601_c0_g1~~TRINITY_DN62601_c0_g1_i1.p2  ORF type:complete len:161 (-),score=4.84 TRINITY_DN62601_c0_g1_i1:73-555(-)